MSDVPICSWCDAEAGIRRSASHGICERHRAEMIAEWKELPRSPRTAPARHYEIMAGSVPVEPLGHAMSHPTQRTTSGEPVQVSPRLGRWDYAQSASLCAWATCEKCGKDYRRQPGREDHCP